MAKKFIKVIIAVCIAAILFIVSCAWCTPRYNFDRCPFCGTEEAFIWYGEPGESYGTCTKCHEDTMRYNLRVNIKSYGNEDQLIEAALKQGNKVIRLNQATGNDTFVEFISVKHGWYQLQVVKGDRMIHTQMIYLGHNTTMNVYQKPSWGWWPS